MSNLEEINKFLETYNLPILNQEETENMNRSNINNGIESAVHTLPTKVQGQMALQVNSVKHFNKS